MRGIHQPAQIVRPLVVIERLLDTVFTIRRYLLVAAALVGLLLLLEPDMGAFVVIAAVAMGVLFLGGVSGRLFAGLVVIVGSTFALLIALSPWRRERIFAYLDPFDESMALGKGYQLSHSLIAFGRGEFFGVGLGGSVEKLHYLPEAHTDFLLAVIGEELGLIAVLAIIGIIYGAIVSFAQSDVKRLVAYSSVSHLGFVMLGIFSLNNAGLQGAILQGVNHGLSTGGLFYLVGVLYEQRHTREMSEFGGVWRAMPVFTALSLIITLSSMGLPGLNGFVGEFTILLGSMNASPEVLQPQPWIYTAFAATGVILAAVYLLWMFQRVFMGPLDNPANRTLKDVNGGQLAIMLSFLLFIFWIGIYPSPYFELVNETVAALVSHVQGAAIALIP